jgi:RluA family pseudouridine synthase
MLVRIKREIIAFGVPGLDPARAPAPKIDPSTLRRWLDEGRPVTLLDTRNDYEVKLGTFQNALPIGIHRFREFPEAVQKLPAALKETPVVMFCTGGIRCEKAGPYMVGQGFKNVFQLDGGILKYFEECGGAHYNGECFVFDQRVGLDPALRETGSTQCFNCLTPLTEREQEDPRYLPPKSCPYCARSTTEEMAASIARRHEKLQQITRPLPGSIPCDNYRPMQVPATCDGLTVLEFLSRAFPRVSASEWRQLCLSGQITNRARVPVQRDDRVRPGEIYLRKTVSEIEPPVNPNLMILHEDEALIVLGKPAPLPMHPSGRFHRNTLCHLLHALYAPQKPRPAHRLDANTTGLVLVARTRHFASKLQPQFARGQVKKSYLVKVQGYPPRDAFSCDFPISSEPGETGSREVDLAGGLPARTEFTVLQRHPGGTALLEARPLTGRTNQIRVHLWELGLPVLGDPVYLPGKKIGAVQTLLPGVAPLCLHASKIAFHHPLTNEFVEFTAPSPAWLE